MPSGYKSGSTDLDSLFKSATSYSGSISSEYKVSGSTSYTRYKARGTTTKRADVGYKISGSDISNNFMDINAAEVDVQGASASGLTAASFQLNTNGNAETSTNGGSYSTVYQWLLGGSSSDFDCRATITTETGAGSKSGTFGSWLNLGSTQTWSVSAGSGQAKFLVFTLEISPAGDNGNILDSASITIDADNTV